MRSARIYAVRPRPPISSGATTLPARYYTDPALFERERDVFFRRMWSCVARVEELPARGSFITREVAGDRLVILREEQAEFRALSNVCRHRGTQLCADAAGTLGGSIQCPYHAWTYDYDGRLLGAPHMEGTPGFKKDDHALGSMAVDTWAGFVFVRPAEQGESLRQQLADLPDKFAPWRLDDLRRAHRIVYDIAANWKLIIQNYSECLHCPNLHPQLNRLSHYLSGENEPLHASYMGGRMDLGDGFDTMSASGRSACEALPGLTPEDRRRVYYYAIFPNLLLSAHPDYAMTHTLWPQAPDRTRLVCEWLFHPDAIARPGFDPADVLSFWDQTNRQDWFVCEQAQIGIGSRGYVPGPYSNREELLHAFDRYVVDKLDI
jgi:Rieske 2Fe-2S family protein